MCFSATYVGMDRRLGMINVSKHWPAGGGQNGKDLRVGTQPKQGFLEAALDRGFMQSFGETQAVHRQGGGV